jgi:hypothetical protein
MFDQAGSKKIRPIWIGFLCMLCAPEGSVLEHFGNILGQKTEKMLMTIRGRLKNNKIIRLYLIVNTNAFKYHANKTVQLVKLHEG